MYTASVVGELAARADCLKRERFEVDFTRTPLLRLPCGLFSVHWYIRRMCRGVHQREKGVLGMRASIVTGNWKRQEARIAIARGSPEMAAKIVCSVGLQDVSRSLTIIR